jgi:hypothetical protein
MTAVLGGLGAAAGASPAYADDLCGGTSGTLHSTLQPVAGGSNNQTTHDLEQLNSANSLNSIC